MHCSSNCRCLFATDREHLLSNLHTGKSGSSSNSPGLSSGNSRYCPARQSILATHCAGFPLQKMAPWWHVSSKIRWPCAENIHRPGPPFRQALHYLCRVSHQSSIDSWHLTPVFPILFTLRQKFPMCLIRVNTLSGTPRCRSGTQAPANSPGCEF